MLFLISIKLNFINLVLLIYIIIYIIYFLIKMVWVKDESGEGWKMGERWNKFADVALIWRRNMKHETPVFPML